MSKNYRFIFICKFSVDFDFKLYFFESLAFLLLCFLISFSNVNSIVSSILLNFVMIFSSLDLRIYNDIGSFMYRKYLEFLGKMWNRPDSRHSRKRHIKTLLKEKPMRLLIFCVKITFKRKKKKHLCLQNSFILLTKGKDVYKGCWKSYKPHPERRGRVEYFCCSNTILLLIKLEKLIQISVLISVQVRPIQRWQVCDKSKINEGR